MKCATQGCENIVIDFTENPTRQCGKCRLLGLMLYFGVPKPDTERLEQTQIDKQELIDAQGYDEGGHYNIQTVTERIGI